MAASFVADLFTTAPTDVTNTTTISGATSVAIAAGNTAFLYAVARGGSSTAQSCSISGLPGDAVVEKSPDSSRSGSPAVQVFRVYFPTGMSSGTTITFTWTQAATRKIVDGAVWTQVANANGIWSVSNNTGNITTPGTTAATTTTTGVHVSAWGHNATLATVTIAPGADEEGTMTERAEAVVGASNFHYLYAEDRPVAAAHAGGMTAAATVTGTIASWAGVQGVWDGATPTKAPPPVSPRRAIRPLLVR